MLQKRIPFLLLIPVLLAGCHQQDPGMDPSRIFPYSAISLMPGGAPEDLDTFRSLHPDIVAWGNDPIGSDLDSARFSDNINAYKALGLKNVASNVWMLTATEGYMYAHPEYQEAICVDLNGDPIVPGWLDAEYRGVKPWWGCTNHPVYRTLLEERAATGVRSGANMLHLDDHMGTCAAALHSGGCFCTYCESGFRNWLEEGYTSIELQALGISSIDTFSYSEFLKSKGILSRDAFIRGGFNKTIPLYEDFISFQRKAAADFVLRLGKLADSIAGKEVPVGVNSWNLSPEQLATAHHADYFSNEVEHYDSEDLVPPFVYLLGNALGKPVFSTGTGEDWIHMNKEMAPVRISRWIATSYAFGNYFMYAYRSWGYSEETGTRWTQVPVDVFAPCFNFIHEHKAIFDGFEPYARTAVLYDNTSARSGDMRSRELCKALHYANIPIVMAVIGDEWLQYDMQPGDLNGIEHLVVPSGIVDPDDLPAFVQRFKEEGTLLSVDDPADIKDLLSSPVKISGITRVWSLPRVRKSKDRESMTVHLLNQDYLAASDEMVVKKNFELTIEKNFWPIEKDIKVEYFTPEKAPVPLDYTEYEDKITVTVPVLNVWGIVRFS